MAPAPWLVGSRHGTFFLSRTRTQAHWKHTGTLITQACLEYTGVPGNTYGTFVLTRAWNRQGTLVTHRHTWECTGMPGIYMVTWEQVRDLFIPGTWNRQGTLVTHRHAWDTHTHLTTQKHAWERARTFSLSRTWNRHTGNTSQERLCAPLLCLNRVCTV